MTMSNGALACLPNLVSNVKHNNRGPVPETMSDFQKLVRVKGKKIRAPSFYNVRLAILSVL